MLNSFLHIQTLTDYQRSQLNKTQSLWKYYNGDFKQWLQPKLLPNGNMIDDNIKIKLARKIVNKGNYFLFGKGLNWQVDEGNTTIETVLQDIWGNQETQNSFLSEVGINGGVVGTFHIQIVAKPNGLKLKNLDPTWIFVDVDPNDQDNAYQYDMRYSQGKDIFRIVHNRKDNNDFWEYRKDKLEKNGWVVVEQPKEWPFEWPFIVSGKNLPNPNNFFGQSDLEDADLNDSINLVASNLNRIIRIFAHPVVWGYGFGSSAMNVDSSKVITATTDKAQLSALELARDLSSPQEYLKFLRTMLSEITNVPESDPDRLRIGAQSGFALQVLFNDLMLKTGIKRSFYGKALIELNRRLLELSGFGDNNQT